MRRILSIFVLFVFLWSGCSQYALVDYRNVDATNSVSVTNHSGATLVGTVVQIEPYQIVLQGKNNETFSIQKTTIRSIKRKEPVKDDFGNGISEKEIQSRQTHRHTLIYGIGGGVLSMGISFFAGSLVGNASSKGGPVFAATFAGGSILGGSLFLHAGKNKDRQTAIERVKDERRNTEIMPPELKRSPAQMQQILDDERKKQEELRKEREELLKQLQQTPNNP